MRANHSLGSVILKQIITGLDYLSRNHLESKEKLLKTVNTLEAISINHNEQKDGVSCGLHVVEAAEEVFLTYPQLSLTIQLTTDPMKNHEKRA